MTENRQSHYGFKKLTVENWREFDPYNVVLRACWVKH